MAERQERSTPGQAADSLDPDEPIGFTVAALLTVAHKANLSDRETDVYVLRMSDRCAKEIGQSLGVSWKYVNTTLARIGRKLRSRDGLPGLRRRTRELLKAPPPPLPPPPPPGDGASDVDQHHDDSGGESFNAPRRSGTT